MPPFPFKLGDTGAAIRDIQRKLASLDPKGESDLIAFKAAPCDGVFNVETVNAVRAFRRINGQADPAGECDADTWRLLNEQAGSVFNEAWQYEMDAMRRGRVAADMEPVRETLAAEAHLHHFAGLAFSGGGIRSATFNLGMLQAMAELKMLRDFDYLSTVSGGGYIGGWFSKWLKTREGNIEDIEQQLRPDWSSVPKSEPEQVKYLRQYTNYLTPKTGFFSADTWALLGTYLRNTVLNLTILASVLAAVMVLPRLLALFINGAHKNEIAWVRQADAALPFSLFSGIATIAALLAVFWIAASVSGIPDAKSKHLLWRQSQNSIIWFTVLPLMVAAFFGSAALWNIHEPIRQAWDRLFAEHGRDYSILWWLLIPGVAYFCAWAAGWGLARYHNRPIEQAREKARVKQEGKPARHDPDADKARRKELLTEALGHFLCAVTVFAVGTALVIMTISALDVWHSAPATGKRAPDLTPAAAQTAAAAQKVTTAARVVTAAAQSVTATAVTVTALAQHTALPTPTAAQTAATDEANTTVPLIAFGMPILGSLFGLTMILSVGLVGRLYTDKSREWWSRQAGWTTIFVTGWLALITVSLYAPGVLGYLHSRLGDWISAALASAWLGTTLAGLMLGKSSATGATNAKSRLEWLARAAPLVFSIGAVFIVSSLLHTTLLPHIFHRLADSSTSFIDFLAAYDLETMSSTFTRLGLTLAGLSLVGVLLAWRVDINKFSLHMMYRNRLVRAYLGASNTARDPHPFTGFDPADDEHLDKLFAPNGKTVQRPYHIINTALNLVNGQELAWQTRKAANFTFTPAFCGFELPTMASPAGVKVGSEAMRGGFRRTADYRPHPAARYDEEKGINLGMAVAVSGAAASPSMGYHSSPPLAFLMTLFNVRLGRWFANPIRPLPPQTRKHSNPDAGQASPPPPARLTRTSPSFGLWYLLNELFGLTDAASNFVYLSDGGHFENLGIYELVRRRCRLIVVVDAGADGQFDFEDLGNAIRKCGTDLNVEVEIDVGKIDLLKPGEFSRSHCVTGRVRYDKIEKDAPIGTLLYIKPSLLGTELADVLNYRKTNKTFPHQPTVDQWFDETQFETYRSLGYDIGKIALQRAAGAALKNALGRHDIISLCEELQADWSNEPVVRTASPAAPAKPLSLVPNNRRMENRRQGANQNAPIPERRKNDERRSV
jgi:hypothetical protein